MIKLKPCPFCGMDKAYVNDNDALLSFVVCPSCGTEGPYAYHSPTTARRLWNKRSKDAKSS